MNRRPPRVSARRLACRLAAAAALAVLASPAATAESTDRQKPVNYFADADMDGNAHEGHVVLRKNVLVTQGTTVIHADELDLTHNEDDTMRAVASGAPVTFQTRVDNSDDFREAYAKKMIYDGKTGIIELFDDVLVRQGQDEQRGQYARYDMNSGQFRFGAKPGTPDSASTPGRVRGVFMPKNEPDAKGGAADKGKAPAPAKSAPAAAKGAAGSGGAGATPPAVPDPVPLKSATDLSTAPR